MDKQTKLAFRILATLCPDCKPSEIRKVIDEVLSKEASQDDIELWMALTKDYPEEKKKETPSEEKKVIEEHHYYHHYDHIWSGPYYYTTAPSTVDKWTITCTDSNTNSAISSDSITVSSNALVL